MGKKIERAADRLAEETGIDFKKYQKSEIVEKISDLTGFVGQSGGIMFRRYAILLIIVVALCAWFYTKGMNSIGIILFFIIGVLFTVFAGTALGTKKVAEKTVEDSVGIVVLMLEVVKEAKHDTAGANVSTSNLVEGISYGVIIPSVSRIVREKLSLLATPVVFVMENSLFYFTKSVSALFDKSGDEIPGETSQEPQAQKQTKEDNKFEQSVNSAKEKLEPLADSVTRKVTIPSKVLLIITLIIGLPILFIIYKVFL